MLESLAGKTINKLTILKEFHKNKRRYCKVQCACGKIFETRRDCITSGNTKSCGCLTHFKPKDIAGKRYGKLIVKKPTGEKSKNGAYKWSCQCDCGNTTIVNIGDLTRGNVRSCGCILKEHQRKHIKEITQDNKKYYIENTSILSIKEKKTPKNNTSGYIGVTLDKRTDVWVAQIVFKGKHHYLGRYKDLQDAIDARKRAEDKYFRPILEKFEKENKEKV